MSSKTKTQKSAQETTSPAFAYTTVPSVLRKLLKEIPKRPKPPKLTLPVVKSWGVSQDTNAKTAVGVLRKIGMLSMAGDPLDSYIEFMTPGTGPRALANKIREHYRKLFENSHTPQNDGEEALRSFFNIHSGGGPKTIDLQVQTFKALCEHADFDGSSSRPPQQEHLAGGNGSGSTAGGNGDTPQLPPVKIDLHIHLPDNKTTREYEAIIQDIAKYIYGRAEVNHG